jgi:hypothetical protein
MVRAIVSHLHIPHFALLSHSGGTLYALNTLLQQREMLHPTRPYVALCAPWVHYSHTDATALKATSLLPAAAIRRLDVLLPLLVNRVGPTIQASGTFFGKMSPGSVGPPKKSAVPAKTKSTAAPSTNASGAGASDSRSTSAGLPIEKPKLDRAERRRINATAQRVFGALFKDGNENIAGVSDEATLLLKRGGSGWFGSMQSAVSWSSRGDWQDYDALVPMLAAREEDMASLGSGSGAWTSQMNGRLKIDVFFAEADHMIGTTKGPEYWEGCWREEKRGGRIVYSSQTVKGTDHDNILDLSKGVAQAVFRAVGGDA